MWFKFSNEVELAAVRRGSKRWLAMASFERVCGDDVFVWKHAKKGGDSLRGVRQTGLMGALTHIVQPLTPFISQPLATLSPHILSPLSTQSCHFSSGPPCQTAKHWNSPAATNSFLPQAHPAPNTLSIVWVLLHPRVIIADSRDQRPDILCLPLNV